MVVLSLLIPEVNVPETIIDYMYAELNPILTPYKVQTEKTLRRLLSTYFLFYFLPADALDADNWKQYTDFFDTIVILKCSKTRMRNFGLTYRYCIFNKSDVSLDNSHKLEVIAREKYHLYDPNIKPTVSQLLDSIPGDVLPIRQTIIPNPLNGTNPNPFATRIPLRSSLSASETPRSSFFSPVTLPSISYASVASLPREPLPKTRKRKMKSKITGQIKWDFRESTKRQRAQ